VHGADERTVDDGVVRPGVQRTVRCEQGGDVGDARLEQQAQSKMRVELRQPPDGRVVEAVDRARSTMAGQHGGHLTLDARALDLHEQLDPVSHELADIESKYSKMIPPDSVPAVSIQYIKGRLASERGDLAGALAELTGAIEFFDKREMAVAPVTRALIARSEVRIKNRNIEAAREDAQRALNISRKLQDQKPHSSLTGLSLLQLAEVESAAGANDVSRELAREARGHLEDTLGAEHPQTLRAIALANN